VEQAYRVLVDEMLQADQVAAGQMGVRFQMRYSVPLFVFAADSALDSAMRSNRRDVKLLSPNLRYRLESEGGRRYLSVHNQGAAHARLANVQLQHAEGTLTVASGLLGYVLPGAWMRWPLPARVSDEDVSLQALINDQREPQTIAGH
jgi:fimbrial chaperone protein